MKASKLNIIFTIYENVLISEANFNQNFGSLRDFLKYPVNLNEIK